MDSLPSGKLGVYHLLKTLETVSPSTKKEAWCVYISAVRCGRSFPDDHFSFEKLSKSELLEEMVFAENDDDLTTYDECRFENETYTFYRNGMVIGDTGDGGLMNDGEVVYKNHCHDEIASFALREAWERMFVVRK